MWLPLLGKLVPELPAPDSDPEFARFTRSVKGGKVHVLRVGLRPIDDSDVGRLLGRQVALCGQTGGPGQLHGLSAFPDEDLCAACHHIWPGPPERLFEHLLAHEDRFAR